MGKKEVLVWYVLAPLSSIRISGLMLYRSYGVDIDAVAGWLGSYGGEDSTSDISRGASNCLPSLGWK